VGEATLVPGDFNLDGAVDASDYVVWRKTDGSENGFNTWRTNFGTVAGSGSGLGAVSDTAVPEPASLVLLLVAGACAQYIGFRISRRSLARGFETASRIP
jgi:hypothetical protein